MFQPPLGRATPPDATLSCQYLFQVTTEFPEFVPSYRWWEDETAAVLWAFHEDARLVIRYALLRDQNILRSNLLGRNTEAIDTLVNLIKPHEKQLNLHLSHDSRVEKILSHSCLPSFKPVPWSCFPPSGPSLDARAIAQRIEMQSHFQLRLIAFEDIVRASLGYTGNSVEWFLRAHTELYVQLLAHLQIHMEEISVYEEVEELLRTQSPFAHRAVLQCLVDLRRGTTSGFPPPPIHGFEFVARPIQILFQERPHSLTEILKICDRNVLGRLLGQTWLELSRIWTKANFSNLSPQSIVAQDRIAPDFLDSWHALTVSVWEVLCAIPYLAPYLQECAQKLFHLRNYHSATAVLHGLREYSEFFARFDNLGSTVGEVPITDSSVPPKIGFLIDDNQNYTAYRQYYLEYPGIPLLRPHLRGGESALQPVFNFMRK
ncbi:Guanine-nucleotide dissociation stimulator CDC25 [Penicillium waksmanii]|uniref:Guanine-nucleotide dissociation stimulator CDC25 n=1 Tax=Penicillium waksmanii TaxID=69791 RepID=UPI002546C60D|nr:Guanine-nucleotide dissociation stimulator CDC25 [Penicillium waksmanii]KAJ6001117.1 Guanine-nucleotide dissociation stimulator CDC25 [Penicillium waksmanii]